MERASILPPQMIDLSLRLDLPGADSPETMADAILAGEQSSLMSLSYEELCSLLDA